MWPPPTSVSDPLSASFVSLRAATPTYIFNYGPNSGISWSIFIIVVPVEREINTKGTNFCGVQVDAVMTLSRL